MVVLGGGKAGKRVAMVEAGMIVGSCFNVACSPTKALVRSAQVVALARRAEEFGRVRTAPVTIDMGQVAARMAAVVAGMVDINRRAFEASGPQLVLGCGRFVAPRVIEVATGPASGG